MARLAFALVLLLVAVAPTAAARHALVIGNDAYEHVRPLENAVGDAKAVSVTLARVGYEVITGTDSGQVEMSQLLSRLVKTVEAGDEVLFYYAGHGVEVAGRNYLLPVDFPALTTTDELTVETAALSLDLVLRVLTQSKARLRIVIIDACRDNPLAAATGRTIGGESGLAPVAAPEGTFIMYSAGVGQRAGDRLSEVDPNPNSVFTRSLLPLMEKPGLSLVELARQVRRDVEALAKTANAAQRPAYYDEVTEDYFFVEPGEKVAEVTPEPVVPEPVPEPETDPAQKLLVDNLNEALGRYQTALNMAASGDYAGAEPIATDASARVLELCLDADYPNIEACIGQPLPELPNKPAVAPTPAPQSQLAKDLNAELAKYQNALNMAAAGDYTGAQPIADAAVTAISELCIAAGYPSIEACIGQSLPDLAKPADNAKKVASADAAPQVSTLPDAGAIEGGQSLLLEASDDGTTGAVPFSGTVVWSRGIDEMGLPTLVGKANIPARNLGVDILVRKNHDSALPASHLVEINFRVSESFIGGSVAGLPGILLKNEELVQGTPLTGASARVSANSFVFALSSSPTDRDGNNSLLLGRRWIDLAIIYATGKRAIITLEKDATATTLFAAAFEAWATADAR